MSNIDREALLVRLEALAEAAGQRAARAGLGSMSEFVAKAAIGTGIHLAITEVRAAPEVVEVCRLKPSEENKSGTQSSNLDRSR